MYVELLLNQPYGGIMKILLLSLIITFSTQAVQVEEAKIIGDTLFVGVSHGGGCGEHDYKLKLGMCLESLPAQCFAEIIHTTNDFCEALLFRTAEFSLSEYGLDKEYFDGASLTITGSRDWRTNKKSSASVRIPFRK